MWILKSWFLTWITFWLPIDKKPDREEIQMSSMGSNTKSLGRWLIRAWPVEGEVAGTRSAVRRCTSLQRPHCLPSPRVLAAHCAGRVRRHLVKPDLFTFPHISKCSEVKKNALCLCTTTESSVSLNCAQRPFAVCRRVSAALLSVSSVSAHLVPLLSYLSTRYSLYFALVIPPVGVPLPAAF